MIQKSVLVAVVILVQTVFVGCSTPKFASDSFLVEDTARKNAPATLTKPYVVLVSIDAYRWDFTKKLNPPNLTQLSLTGAGASALLPVYPSKTFTNHWSIITGMYAGNHGIVGNTFYDSGRSQRFEHTRGNLADDGTWYGGDPLWRVAERQGMLSSTFFWPGSAAEIRGVHASHFYRFNRLATQDDRVRKLREWLKLPADRRPHLMTFYFYDVDRAGHAHGPESAEVANAVQLVDNTLGEMMTEIKDSGLPVHLVVLSDHGMIQINKSDIRYLDDYTDLSGAVVLGKGSQSFIYSKNKKILRRIERDLKKMGPNFKVYRKSQIPKAWHIKDSPRVGDLVVDAKAPFEIGVKNPPSSFEMGSHGFDPDVGDQMRGIFYATGPKIIPGASVEPFRNIHIYPWLLKILELDPPQLPKGQKIDGDASVLDPLLKPEFR